MTTHERPGISVEPPQALQNRLQDLNCEPLWYVGPLHGPMAAIETQPLPVGTVVKGARDKPLSSGPTGDHPARALREVH